MARQSTALRRARPRPANDDTTRTALARLSIDHKHAGLFPPRDDMRLSLRALRQDLLERQRRAYLEHRQEIDPTDEMWLGLVTNMPPEQKPYARLHYMYGGRSALRGMVGALVSAQVPLPRRILDFPCGHGRVTRFLRAAFPEAEIWAGDVNRQGVDFCASHFGSKPVYSDVDLAKVRIDAKFDLVWCGSLATHLPEEACRQLLGMLLESLEEGGILGITTCGRAMDWAQNHRFKTIREDEYARIRKQWDETGFGYADYPGWPGYGMTFMDPSWLFREVFKREGYYVLGFDEKGWHGTQDVLYVVRRPVSHWYHWSKDN
jgi:SAM-dependent methyltransferase